MGFDYFQNSIAAMEKAAAGLVLDQANADISPNFAVEDATGIGMGIAVSRGTNAEKQITAGGAVGTIFGITTRVSDPKGPGGLVNAPFWEQYAPAPIIHSGYVWVPSTGTGTAGSTTVSYNTTTGAIVLGAPGAGELALTGVTLWNTVTVSGSLALLRLSTVKS